MREREERINEIAEGVRLRDAGLVGPPPAVEVHHLTYERLPAELPEDLEADCAPWHRQVQGGKGGRR